MIHVVSTENCKNQLHKSLDNTLYNVSTAHVSFDCMQSDKIFRFPDLVNLNGETKFEHRKWKQDSKKQHSGR